MTLCRPLAVATLCLFSYACSAGVPSITASSGAVEHAAERMSPNTPPAEKAANTTTSLHLAPTSMCGLGDKVVFSCPLAKGTKIASMCASQGKADAEPTFYYAFGHAGAPELRLPASGGADNAAFSRTHLGFAGNTGGYAYSFANAGYKYIVYSISGDGASYEGGVIVQSSDKSKNPTKLTCRSTAITETSDDSLIDATLRLKKDQQIESSGLPETQ
ncbi:MAG: hypothetical protein ABI767_00080 [Rhodanobacter sp.]